MNTQSGSQDLVNLGISSVTGSLIGITNTLMAFTAALDNTYATDAQLYQLYQATSSIQFATRSLNIQTGSQDIVNFNISTYTGSQNVINSSVDSHILKQATQTGSQDLVNLGISSVTGSLIGITNGLMAFTAALDNTYATDAQLYQLYHATASLNTQTGSQDLVNLGISSVTGSLIGITNGLMAFTAALDSTYATDAQLYQLYQATASLNTQTGSQDIVNFNISVVTSSIDSHILKQATQTGSQDLVNLGISTFTGSLRSEIAGIEAYTASLKGAAIVSSSQQITNYYKFAETASASTTFYGNVTASALAVGSGTIGRNAFIQSDFRIAAPNDTNILNGIASNTSMTIKSDFYGGGSATPLILQSVSNNNQLYLATNGSITSSGNFQIGNNTINSTLKLSGDNSGGSSFITFLADNDATKAQIETTKFSSDGGILYLKTLKTGVLSTSVTLNQLGDVTIDNGNLIIGTSGKGIDFSANSNAAGMTSELLNDYEEGTWTVGISFGGNSVGITTSRNTGTYVKVGRQVTVNGDLILTSKGSSSGAARITGLPFTNGAGVSNLSPIILRLAKVTFANQLQGYVEVSATTISLEEITEAGTVTQLSNSDFANDSELMVTATYFV
jgi:hypothetical protein